jgi:hypothetical protein
LFNLTFPNKVPDPSKLSQISITGFLQKNKTPIDEVKMKKRGKIIFLFCFMKI